MKKIIILFEGNFDIDGQPRHFRKGEEVEVSDIDARRLVADLCAEYPQDKQDKVRSNGRKNSK